MSDKKLLNRIIEIANINNIFILDLHDELLFISLYDLQTYEIEEKYINLDIKTLQNDTKFKDYIINLYHSNNTIDQDIILNNTNNIYDLYKYQSRKELLKDAYKNILNY